MTIRIDGTNTAANPGITGTDADTGLQFGTDEVSIVTGGTEQLKVESDGRLLVGTSSESGSSTVVVRGRPGVSAAEGQLELGRNQPATTPFGSGDPLGKILFTDNGSNVYSQIVCEADGTSASGDYPGRLVFSTSADGASSPTERMRLSSQGALWSAARTSVEAFGGTVHYSGFLQNHGGQWTLGLTNKGNEGDNGHGLSIDYPDTTPNGTGNPFIHAQDSSQVRFVARSNGGLANYQSNNANLCDEREKKNIETLDSTWDCLKNWDLKKFHYNEDSDTDNKRYGVIAQQVEEHCPEVITDWLKQNAKDAVLDDDGNVVTPAKEEIIRKGVKEQQMVWMAIKALQEAMARIETLETQNASLEARLTALEGGAE